MPFLEIIPATQKSLTKYLENCRYHEDGFQFIPFSLIAYETQICRESIPDIITELGFKCEDHGFEYTGRVFEFKDENAFHYEFMIASHAGDTAACDYLFSVIENSDFLTQPRKTQLKISLLDIALDIAIQHGKFNLAIHLFERDSSLIYTKADDFVFQTLLKKDYSPVWILLKNYPEYREKIEEVIFTHEQQSWLRYGTLPLIRFLAQEGFMLQSIPDYYKPELRNALMQIKLDSMLEKKEEKNTNKFKL